MPNNVTGSYGNPFGFDFSQRSIKQYKESAINVAKHLLGFGQNIDMYNYGVIVNNKVEWLSDARLIKQYYDTNILYTELENEYVHVIQKTCTNYDEYKRDA